MVNSDERNMVAAPAAQRGGAAAGAGLRGIGGPCGLPVWVVPAVFLITAGAGFAGEGAFPTTYDKTQASEIKVRVIRPSRPNARHRTRSDVLTLTNGDRLTGHLAGIAAGALTFATSYAPEFTVPLADVASLKAQGDFAVTAPKGPSEATRLEVTEGEIVFLAANDQVPPPTEPDAGEDEAAPAKPPVLWKGKVSVGYTATSGNRDDRVGSLSLKAKRESGLLTLLFDGTGRCATRSGTRTANFLKLGAEGNYDIDGWFYYTRLEGETDQFEELNIRANVSGGVGRHFWKNSDKHLTGKIGASYEYENFFGGVTDHSAQARLDVDYKHKLLPRITFGQLFTMFPNPGKVANSRIESTSQVDIALDENERLSVRIEYETQYDGEPRPDVEAWDSILSSSLVYKF